MGKFGKIWENLVYEKKRRGVVVITTAQLSSTRSTLEVCTTGLPAERWKFVKVRISDSGFDWK